MAKISLSRMDSKGHQHPPSGYNMETISPSCMGRGWGGVGPRVNTLVCKLGVYTGVLIFDLKKLIDSYFNDVDNCEQNSSTLPSQNYLVKLIYRRHPSQEYMPPYSMKK